MYLMYVDESGDCGVENSPSQYFCLAGVVVHELHWGETLGSLIQFRRYIKSRYRVYLDDELHAAAMISKPSRLASSLRKLRKHERLAIVRQFADQIAKLRYASIIGVCLDKRRPGLDADEVFRRAWYTLFQRFENTIRQKNFPGRRNDEDRGIIFADDTDGGKLSSYLNRMRLRNPLKMTGPDGSYYYKDEPVKMIIEDPMLRDSRQSYLIQAADCAVYLIKQSIQPSAYMKAHGGSAYFRRLQPVVCQHATHKNKLGIVML